MVVMKHVKAIALATLAFAPASVLAACGTSGSSTASSSSTAVGTSAMQGTTPNGHPPAGMGSEVTGSAATKAGKAATAKYPGTVERVMKLGDGSYVVHVTTYLVDRGDFDAFNEAFVETFAHPFPARVTVLAQLIVPDLRIEVTAVAARPR